jgi:leucyl/phenylalanyl-tRNA--protein transferase
VPDAFDDDRERIRKSVDIVDLVRSYISLQRKGSSFVGICPWHSDSNPSLTVRPARQSWRCWVCNLGGDIFSFVMQIEGVDFLEAKRMLAERAGIDLSDGGRSASHDKSSLFENVQWAEKRFHDMLLHGAEAEPAREYLAERGINSESVERYRMGFSPRSNERELIEILLLAPELIELVIEMVELDYFVHAGCREIYQLMLDLHSQGLTTGFENIRHRLETIEGQSLLVAIDDEARVKAETALSPAERWETLDAMMREESSRSDEAEKRKALSPGLDDSAKMDILTSLADSIRARIIPVDPKDVFGIELERLPDDGLVFVGGDCSSTWMLAAYRRGIFPWPHLDHRDAAGNAHHQLAWYCPNPRWVLTPQSLHIPRRLARRLRRREFKFSVNRRFEECVRLVARSEQTEETWLSPELELGYRRLMKQGHALSLEVWQDGELVGAVIAVVVGGFASAESMFYTRRDASKAGLVTMVQLLARAGYQMIDVQQPSAHCCQLGAFSLTRNQFLIQHAEAVEQKVRDLGDFSL